MALTTTAARLRAIRHSLKLTQADMADLLGLNLSTYKMRESESRGKETRYLPPELVEKLAAAAIAAGKDAGPVYALAGYDPRERLSPQGLSDQGAIRYRPREESALEVAVRAWQERGANREPWLMRDRGLTLGGILPGDIAIVDLGQPPAAGDLGLASITDRSGWSRSVIRLYRPPYLVAMTHEPSLLTPVLIDCDSVVLRGRIIAVIREITTP